MTRLSFALDPVDVRLAPAPVGPVPEQFLWRGRQYVVLEVLDRWTESGGWWRNAAVTALTGGGPAPRLGAAVGAAGIDDGEQQWWRVEAASGGAFASSAGAGVYDLCFTEVTSRWTLARIQD